MSIASSAELITPIPVGSALPKEVLTATIQDMDGKNTTLQTILGDKAAILIIYRGAW